MPLALSTPAGVGLVLQGPDGKLPESVYAHAEKHECVESEDEKIENWINYYLVIAIESLQVRKDKRPTKVKGT